MSSMCSAAQSCSAICGPMDDSLWAPLPMEFSRQEYWSRLPFPSPGDLPEPRIKPASLVFTALQEDSSPTEPSGKPFSKFHFSSVAQSCPTLCDPMNHSTPGFSVHHQLPEFTQTHVHRVGDAIQPPHPLDPFSSCPQSLPASESFPMSQLFT